MAPSLTQYVYLIGIILTTLGITAETFAQPINGRPFVTNYTFDDYNAGLQNWHVGQDDDGVMYFANNDGLMTFDGVRWQVNEASESNNIRCFDIAPDGRVYIGSSVTFGYFERDSLGYISYVELHDQEGIIQEELTEVWTVDYTGEYVYFQSRTRLYRLKERADGKWDVKTWDPEGNDLFMYAFWRDGEYYVHQRGVGLLKIVGDELEFIEGSEVLANDRMQVMLNISPSAEGTPRYLLSQFEKGMYIYDGETFEPFQTENQSFINQSVVYKGLEMPDGRLVLGTLAGGAIMINEDGAILERYDEGSALLSNSVYSIFLDNSGSMWLGLSDGISRIEIASPTTQFTADDGISATPFAVRIYRDNLYVGTGNYMLKYDRVTRRLNEIPGLSRSQYFSVEVIDDCLLMTGAGLYQLCGDDLYTVKKSVAGDFQNRYVVQGISDPTLIYVGTIEGLAVFRRTNPGDGIPSWQYLGKFEETNTAEVRDVYPMEDGSIWVNGFNSGLYHIASNDGGAVSPDRPYELKLYNEEHGLTDGGAAVIQLFDEVYFGGLDTCYRYDEESNKFTPIPDFESVRGEGGQIYAIPYSRDTFILNLEGAASYVTKKDEGGFDLHPEPFAAFRAQGMADIYVDKKKQIWFSTNTAVIKYDPRLETGSVQEYNTLITEVKLENQRISLNQLFDESRQKPILKHDHEAIRFAFASPFFYKEEEIEFQFWLENFAKNWSDWTDENYKEYTNLPPGEYAFHVRAKNVYGVVGNEAVYSFRIEAPWYRTWWAYLLYVIAGLAFIGFIVRQRTSQLKRRSEELEATVAERTAQITAQVEQQEALFKLSSEIAAAETEDEICESVAEGLQTSAFDYPFVGVLIKEENSHDLVLKASRGWKTIEKGFRLKAGQGLCGKVLKTGQLQYNPDVSSTEAHFKINGAGSEADMPIKVGDEVVGVLVVEHDSKDAFDKADLDILTTAASQAGVALGQAYSHSQVEQRLRELGTVDEISQLITAKLNQEQLFELIGQQMREIFTAQIVYIALYDEPSGMITFPWMHGEELTPIKFGEGLTSKVIRDNRPLLINESMSERHEQMGIAPKGHISASYLGVPIPADDRVIGVLSVQSTESEGRFDENDMRLLQTIATHVGIAIQNAALFDELKQAKAVAEDANEAKSAFLSTVSHELRTPLTSVLGFAKIIRKRLQDKLFPLIGDSDSKVTKTKSQVMENLDVVVSEGERLTGLINDVLDLAKIEAGKIEWHMADVSPATLIERATASTSSLFDESPLGLNIKVQPDLPDVWGDENKLLQVLINLLSNAVKFTDDGSVTIKAEARNGEVIMSVTDTGAGITIDDQAKIFDKFKQVGDTLTDKPKGTGLGLPISKEIIEHHGGSIWVESEEGVGSTFFFSLPLKDSGDGEKRPIDLGRLMAHLRTQVGSEAMLNPDTTNSILVVDDEANIRSLLQQELTEAGFNVRQASNGKEALDKVRNERPDLIILDVMMPEMNGFDLAAVLKNDPETMDIPIIILSVLRDKERGYRLGIDRYLTKPIEIETLLQEIDHLLEQGKSRKKVMVVDEDQSTIKTLGDVLQSQGYQVVEANGAELLKSVLDSKPDIILLNSVLSENRDIIQSIRFEKGMENVLFLIYQ